MRPTKSEIRLHRTCSTVLVAFLFALLSQQYARGTRKQLYPSLRVPITSFSLSRFGCEVAHIKSSEKNCTMWSVLLRHRPSFLYMIYTSYTPSLIGEIPAYLVLSCVSYLHVNNKNISFMLSIYVPRVQ